MVYRLETERLRLREWLPEDREPLAAMNADRRVMEFFPHPLSRAESDAFFDRIVAEWAESGRGLYAVERRGDGRLIGLTGLHRAAFEASFTPCIEIGWRFVAEVWGQGYATEAAAAVRDYWFGMVGAPWLAGFHASQNVASSRVLAKTGFHYDHDTVLHRFDGTEVPCLAWYLLNPGSQKSDEPAAAAPAVQAEPTEPAENAETTV